MRDAAPLTEPVFVPDIFVSGLADLAALGELRRLSFYADRSALGMNPAERIIVCHLVMAAETEQRILRAVLARCRLQ